MKSMKEGVLHKNSTSAFVIGKMDHFLVMNNKHEEEKTICIKKKGCPKIICPSTRSVLFTWRDTEARLLF